MVQKIQVFLSKFWFIITFCVLGLGSLLWFLLRVIPKPSRAAYPCMRATVPLASSFVAYLFGITTFTVVLKIAKERFHKSKYLVATLFGVLGLAIGIWTIVHNTGRLNAAPLADPQPVNEPIGEGKGNFPGRVVWVHNPEATNEDCTNDVGDYWWMDKNTDQSVVDAMLSSGIRELTGTSNDANAWDSIFRYYNNNHGKGNVDYQSGEKIAIKINLNGLGNVWTSDPPQNINTSPQICYAILNQLINVVGVAQADISIGDPNIIMDDATWDKCHTAFPNVKYMGKGTGQTLVVQSSSKVLCLSDGSYQEYLPQTYVDAAYMINIPVLKKHHRAGISLCSKNHFGSVTPFTGDAFHLHPSLPCPEADAVVTNGEYGAYRCFVDIMGHKDLGGKTILYLIDGIWGSTNWGHPPIKWRMPPFNTDWPSSLFLSQDPVAIESVGFDFLYYEFDENHPTEGEFEGGEKGPFPHFAGTDDFLHQSADPTKWPSGITYDPENNGSPLTSMGVHEHWKNAIDKEYTRNLGNGDGIELIYSNGIPTSVNMTGLPVGFEINTNYPNPFFDKTTISYTLATSAHVQFDIFDINGQHIKSVNEQINTTGKKQFVWNATNNSEVRVPNGSYYYRIIITNESGKFQKSGKMLLISKD